MSIVVRALEARFGPGVVEETLAMTLTPAMKMGLRRSRSLVASLTSVISAKSWFVDRLDTPTNSMWWPEEYPSRMSSARR
jgi:hypothetical protein